MPGHFGQLILNKDLNKEAMRIWKKKKRLKVSFRGKSLQSWDGGKGKQKFLTSCLKGIFKLADIQECGIILFTITKTWKRPKCQLTDV